MKFANFNTDERVFIVAEVGNNHEGDFTLAQEMVGRAAEAGVDAVKFQTFIPELFVAKDDTDRIAKLRSFQLSFSQFEILASQAQSAGVVFFSTPLDLESAEFLNSVQSIFKIASGDNTFWPLIEKVASFGKPAIVSTGLATMELLHSIRQFWQERASAADLAYLHCVASYPAPLEQANIGAISSMVHHFGDVTIGYSDHTLGIETAVYAVAAGARIMEKHFTLDHQQSDFRDHKLSANPAEMKNLVNAIRRVETIRGSGEKIPQACEEDMRVAITRSIAAVRDLPRNHELELQDFCWVRPASGIPVGKEKDLLGRRTKAPLPKGAIIHYEDLV